MAENLSSALVDLARSISPLADVGEVEAENAALTSLIERVDTRRSYAPTTLVVALAGTTGAGKSSLFNTLAGGDYSRVGVLRPTTSAPTAVILGAPESGVGKLLDWLQVTDRHFVPGPGDEQERIVLIDLPDIDSITTTNREVAERYLEVVDVIVWVVDPEKYADSRVHDEYLRPSATLAPVMDVVLNQIDRLQGSDAEVAVADLRRRLDDAGITSEILPTSVRTGEGLGELRTLIHQRAAARQAQATRLTLDARRLAERLQHNHPFTHADQERVTAALEVFEVEVPQTVGARQFAVATGREYRHLLRRRTTWPPLRLLHKSRAFPPSAELHTGYLAQPVGRLLMEVDGEGAWPRLLRRAVDRDRLERQLRAYRPQRVDGAPPGWSRLAGALGWLSVGLLFGALAVFGVEVGVRYFGFSLPPALESVPAEPPYPALPALPWSVAVGVAAILFSLVVSGISAVARRVSVRRLRARVLRTVSRDVTHIVAGTVTDPLREHVAEAASYRGALMKITQTG